MKIIEIKPSNFDGKEIKEIELDLDSITGKVLLDSEREFTMGQNINLGVLQNNMAFATIVASKVANVDIDFIKALPAPEFNEVIMTIQGFLISGE
jgi:hypothetical protein